MKIQMLYSPSSLKRVLEQLAGTIDKQNSSVIYHSAYSNEVSAYISMLDAINLLAVTYCTNSP